MDERTDNMKTVYPPTNKVCGGIKTLLFCIMQVVCMSEFIGDWLCIGESPSICPFLKNNGPEAPQGPRVHYFF